MCALGDSVDCRAREVHRKISCAGTDENSERCENESYEGETSRSTGERFDGHMKTLRSKSDPVRQVSMGEHMWESHNGTIPPLKFEILKKFPGDPALRQATEAVSIRRNKPTWNGKEEWSNEPRKPKGPSMRRSDVRKVTSNNEP